VCVFCQIIAGNIPSYKIYEDEQTFAFLDIAEDFVGHTLVIPKAHYESVLDCPVPVFAAVMETVQKVSAHYVDDCGYTGVNILNASGASAQQSVFHLHFHIVPRTETDALDMWPKGGAEMDLSEIHQSLKMD